MYKFWNYEIYDIEQYSYIAEKLYTSIPKFIYKRYYPYKHRKGNMEMSYDKLRMYNLIDNKTYVKLQELSIKYDCNSTYIKMINLLNKMQLNCIGW
jgi:hypothetical protein